MRKSSLKISQTSPSSLRVQPPFPPGPVHARVLLGEQGGPPGPHARRKWADQGEIIEQINLQACSQHPGYVWVVI